MIKNEDRIKPILVFYLSSPCIDPWKADYSAFLVSVNGELGYSTAGINVSYGIAFYTNKNSSFALRASANTATVRVMRVQMVMSTTIIMISS